MTVVRSQGGRREATSGYLAQQVDFLDVFIASGILNGCDGCILQVLISLPW